MQIDYPRKLSHPTQRGGCSGCHSGVGGKILPLEQAGHACAFQHQCLDLNFEAARKDAYPWPVRPLAALLTYGDPSRLAKFRVSPVPVGTPKRQVKASDVHSLSFQLCGRNSVLCHCIPSHSALVIHLLALGPTPFSQPGTAGNRPLLSFPAVFATGFGWIWPLGGMGD